MILQGELLQVVQMGRTRFGKVAVHFVENMLSIDFSKPDAGHLSTTRCCDLPRLERFLDSTSVLTL